MEVVNLFAEAISCVQAHSTAERGITAYRGSFLSRGNPRGAQRSATSWQLPRETAADEASSNGGRPPLPQKAAHGSAATRSGKRDVARQFASSKEMCSTLEVHITQELGTTL